jgi:hypothetical protein
MGTYTCKSSIDAHKLSLVLTYLALSSMFADSKIRSRVFMYQGASGFDYNPGSVGRFYNISFNLAITQHYEAPSSKKGCFLFARYFDKGFYMTDTRYGPNFKSVGPFQFDASFYRNNVYSRFEMYRDEAGNGTVLIDNVRFTQGGQVVGVSK